MEWLRLEPLPRVHCVKIRLNREWEIIGPEFEREQADDHERNPGPPVINGRLMARFSLPLCRPRRLSDVRIAPNRRG